MLDVNMSIHTIFRTLTRSVLCCATCYMPSDVNCLNVPLLEIRALFSFCPLHIAVTNACFPAMLFSFWGTPIVLFLTSRRQKKS